MDYQVPHLSCYALTVEPRTALKKFIEKGIVPPVDDEQARAHHDLLVEFFQRRVLSEFLIHGSQLLTQVANLLIPHSSL